MYSEMLSSEKGATSTYVYNDEVTRNKNDNFSFNITQG